MRVPAKINLQLSVGGLREDGFHDIATVFHAVGLYDEISASEASEGVSLRIEGEGARVLPLDHRNLAVRAVQVIAAHDGRPAAVELNLSKRIPLAGGMAGGSADAAAALVACDALWRLGLGRETLSDMAAGLGSDVPFALLGGTAIGMGRGEQVTTILTRGDYHWVIAVSEGQLSTPEVYAMLDRQRGAQSAGSPHVDEALIQALASGDPGAVGRSLRNDLQPAALEMRPQLAAVLAAGDELGALAGIVSGSGPTCVFLARGHDHALDIAASLSAMGLVRSVRHAAGPVGGAQVID